MHIAQIENSEGTVFLAAASHPMCLLIHLFSDDVVSFCHTIECRKMYVDSYIRCREPWHTQN